MAFSDGTADFRSDTVTRPTEAMRRAMAAADVGDDVYSEDPTVAALEEEAARLVGKEAALYTPSGTMGNQLAINLLAAPGTELVAVDDAHVRDYERAAASMISGVAFRTVGGRGGVIGAEALGDLMAAAGTIRPRISVLVWENTHNASGGRVVPLEVMTATTEIARRHGLAVHLDGARLFNAVTASGVPADRYAALADTVQFCFSKGLGAPVGSILCGDAGLIGEARYRRRQLGGGMRQAGVIAAAALVALADRDRLHEDHALAERLATGLSDRFPKAIDPDDVETNMVMVDDAGLPWTATEVIDILAAARIRVGLIRPGVLRFVTHRDVDEEDVERLLGALDGALKERG
ncbi:MAG TPA: GntG family PLP-dependent aldolase [Acidimicrobiia bacterium]|nr:GntG family PLP-dependent aldolase [Acidimicrobiia bacterium]